MITDSLPYVPILPAKTGEIFALKGVTMTRKGADLRPVIVLPQEISQLLIPRLERCWGKDDKFYVDPCRTLATSSVAKFFSDALHGGMKPIAVANPKNSLPLLAVIGDMAKAQGGRICIRLPAIAATKDDCERRLAFLIETLQVRPRDADLVVDFGYIREPAFHQADAFRVLEFLPGFGDWRSVTYAASSFPKSLADCGEYQEIAEGIYKIVLPRVEIETFEALTAAGWSIGFGDSAVTYAELPTGPAPDFRPTANLRYTVADSFVLLRGVHDNGNEDVRRLCRALVGMPEYRNATYSAGDAAIYRCAFDKEGHGATSKWREWDINHHFEETMDRIASPA